MAESHVGKAPPPSTETKPEPASASDDKFKVRMGRLDNRYHAHKAVALGSISSRPTAASGLPADTEPSTESPETAEDAMRQAWKKVFGPSGKPAKPGRPIKK